MKNDISRYKKINMNASPFLISMKLPDNTMQNVAFILQMWIMKM